MLIGDRFHDFLGKTATRHMLRTLTTIAFYSISLCCTFADQVFDGPICMRGSADGNIFDGPSFGIEMVDGGFSIICNPKKAKFDLRTDARVLQDAIVSCNQGAVAVSLRKTQEWGGSQAVIATISASGKVRIYEFRDQRMTEQFGWLVELGAVSDDGRFILAKCATFLPKKNGRRWVNHRWTVLAIDDGSLKVVEILGLEEALARWSEYTKADNMARSQIHNPQPASGKPSPSGKGESPNTSRSAPRQPPEGPPPAKPGSAPR
jgi:hypothetical protein